MRVNGLNTTFSPDFSLKNKKITMFGNNQLTTDVVDIDPLVRKENIAKKIFERKGKFDIEKYQSLSKVEKEIIREVSHHSVKIAASENVEQGLKLKKQLDRLYGKNKYVFVCIGTSPACIARVMEFSGVETKYIPISGLGKAINYNNINRCLQDTNEYTRFLTEQGISNEEIEKSGKKYLFFDYINSGKTLEFFQQIMEQNFGVDSTQIEYLSLNEALESANSMVFSKDKSEEYIWKYLTHSYSERFCGVPHINYRDLNEIYSVIAKESPVGKQYNFFVIDELNKLKLLKHNTKNEGLLL